MMNPGVTPPAAGSAQGHEPAEVMPDLPGVVPECPGPGSLQTGIRPAPSVVTVKGHSLTS